MIAALPIFVVAGLIATAVSALASRVMGDTALGRVVATGVPILVMTIATFMILDQLKIAHNIVVITYAALLGAIALGSALAFGLGGRAVAERVLEGAYQSTQENKAQWKRDLDQGLAAPRTRPSRSRTRWSDAPTESETRVAQVDAGPLRGLGHACRRPSSGSAAHRAPVPRTGARCSAKPAAQPPP